MQEASSQKKKFKINIWMLIVNGRLEARSLSEERHLPARLREMFVAFY